MAKKDSHIIIPQAPGIATLKPRGHSRREQLKKRTDGLAKRAEVMMNATDAQTYSVDPEKLKAEPEILKHLNFSDMAFEVTSPVVGKVYFWCRDEPNAISMKRIEARMWLGAQSKGWEIVGAEASGTYPEAMELKAVDGRRVIGDVFLMRIDLDEYTKIHKRMLLVQKYRETNIPEPLSDWVTRHEGLVTVRSGNKEPQELYKDVQRGGALQHAFRGKMVTADGLAGEPD